MENNIFFYLTPKASVKYLDEKDNLRQAVEKMQFHNYTSIPVVSQDGRYLRSVSDQDIVRYIHRYNLDLDRCENHNITEIDDVRPVRAIRTNKTMNDLVDIIVDQNYVPVIDDEEHFIGIVTRKTVITYLVGELKENNKK